VPVGHRAAAADHLFAARCRPHFSDLAAEDLARMYANESRAVHCELDAGGVVFFSFATPHATGANLTGHARTGGSTLQPC
jgi:ectoine hydroxylase-related dioxygenase (phytanoyl-CoA dioxygenase family)